MRAARNHRSGRSVSSVLDGLYRSYLGWPRAPRQSMEPFKRPKESPMVLRRLVRLSAVFIGVFVIATFAFASATLAAGGSTYKSTTSLAIGGQVHLGSGPFGPGATVSISYTCLPGF